MKNFALQIDAKIAKWPEENALVLGRSLFNVQTINESLKK